MSRGALPPARWSRALVLAGLVLAGLVGGLTGCFGGKNPDARCNAVSEYQQATSIPLVVAPDGLTAPNRGSGYVVPPPVADAKVDEAACLARPPDYFRKDPGVPPAQ